MKAIIDEQLEGILTKLGVWEEFCKGTIKCSRCKRVIDINNIGLFIPQRGEDGNRKLVFYCNDPDCINDALNA